MKMMIGSLILSLVWAGCGGGDFLFEHKDAFRQETVKVTHRLKDISFDVDVDILWIIDNSGSMDTYQQTVMNNTQSFMQQFTSKAQFRWKMGLISTSTYNTPYLGFSSSFDWKSPNPVPTFQSAVSRLGTSGDSIEKIFDPVINALTTYPTFLRKDAYFAMIVVTDTKDQSYNYNTSQRFLDRLKTLVPLDKVLVYAAIGPMDWGCSPTDDAFNYLGSEYEKLINTVHGKGYKICDPTFGNSLVSIATDIVSSVATPRIYLQKRPVPETIRVFYKGKEIPGGINGTWVYDYDLNSIIFQDLTFAPGDTESVEIQYEELVPV
jgi:hypothetical protein